MSISLAAQNLARVVWNRTAKLYRRGRHWTLRRQKDLRETGKHARAQVKLGREAGRDTAQTAYAGLVRGSRYWDRLRRRTWATIARDVSARRTLRAAAAGSGPILLGPWLSEVGYEALYWVPFVRWFTRQYDVDADRVIAVSRGGVASWYGGIASRYVEQFDLFTPEEFASRNEARRGDADQKQLALSGFDEEILSRARARLGIDRASICHPSTMFQLMRQFWLGNDSLQSVLDYTEYESIAAGAHVDLPKLPDRFVAVKFYTGRALMDTAEHREALRRLVERLASRMPIVALNTNLSLDEHADYVFKDVPGVVTLDGWMTPHNNLAVQTEVIRRATRLVGTCGSLAWLAPMLGTETLAVYADDHFLTPHLYAARHAYASMDAARFTPMDLAVLDQINIGDPARVRDTISR
ncbi:MAG: hypothetical protein DMF87_08275 [Acidobacteria bacterium]|nr:MAG: hypothetical protein DMF87_08275 [Acidobacteriota bacterium]